MTLHRLIGTRPPSEAATHLVLDADSQSIARGAAAGCVRVRDARVAVGALEVARAAAAAELVWIGREGGRCGRRCWRRR
jgi:hypothetical protein